MKRRGISRYVVPRHSLSDMPPARSLEAVGGHYLGSSVERLFEGRPVRRTMLLRDPVSHLVSYYNFRMSRYMDKGRRAYSFDLAYRSTQRDFVTHFILRNFLEIPWARILLFDDAEKWALVNQFLSTFWFVGDYSYCNDLIAALAPELGVPEEAERHNVSVDKAAQVRFEPMRLEDLSPRTVRKIRQENRLDQRLWETWREAQCNVDQVEVKPLRMTAPWPRLWFSESTRFFYEMQRRMVRG